MTQKKTQQVENDPTIMVRGKRQRIGTFQARYWYTQPHISLQWYHLAENSGQESTSQLRHSDVILVTSHGLSATINKDGSCVLSRVHQFQSEQYRVGSRDVRHSQLLPRTELQLCENNIMHMSAYVAISADLVYTTV